MNMTRKDLISRLQELVSQYGHDWKAIARVLNEEKVPTLKGEAWNHTNARVFFTRATQGGPKLNLKKASGARTRPNTVTGGFPEWLDKAAVDDLRDIVEWWRARKGEPSAFPQQRPVFRGERKNTGIHCNQTILKRAMEKVKTDKVRTGGSLSLLVEWLLWRYIGEPEDVLEPLGPTNESD